jgi:DNA mismatch repair protein MutS
MWEKGAGEMRGKSAPECTSGAQRGRNARALRGTPLNGAPIDAIIEHRYEKRRANGVEQRMTPAERRAFERQLQQEFPGLELHAWYRQYRSLKAAYPDAILLYRLGDFYETFDDDAKLVADLLEVTLTHKEFASQKGHDQKQRCPMAGIPYHAVEGYVARLVGAGYRVAIAEQITETPSSRTDTRPRSIFAAGIEQTSLTGSNRMVERKVVRVITPGTIIESGMLPAERNNYLAALIADHGRIGLAYADLSTGEFAAVEFSGERAAQQAQGELTRINAAEILVPDRADLRLPGLEPSSARLEQDLEFLTREERELLLPGSGWRGVLSAKTTRAGRTGA